MIITLTEADVATLTGLGKATEVKGKAKKRVKKDKDAPKKPMSPFFCYQAVRRQQIKVEQPAFNNTEIIKVTLPIAAWILTFCSK